VIFTTGFGAGGKGGTGTGISDFRQADMKMEMEMNNNRNLSCRTFLKLTIGMNFTGISYPSALVCRPIPATMISLFSFKDKAAKCEMKTGVGSYDVSRITNTR
jgi:hypothetical protein